MAVTTKVGNGEGTLFWTDRWLQGKSISELVPRLFDGIPKRRRKSRMVREALNNNTWSLIFLEPSQSECYSSICNFGIPSKTSTYNQIPRTLMLGASPLMGSTQRKQHMRPCLLESRVQPMGKNLEDMGSPKMSLLHVVSSP
jgi:hypothetical protein